MNETLTSLSSNTSDTKQQQQHTSNKHHHHNHNGQHDQQNHSFANNETINHDDPWLIDLARLHSKVVFFRNIYLYFGTIITILGATLNTLCIIVFYNSKLFRNSSFPYYVYVISVVDTLNIFLRFLVPQSFEKIVRTILNTKFEVSPYEINQEAYDGYIHIFLYNN